MYLNAYNQLQSLPANNQCQKDMKDKLLNEFESNVKRNVGQDEWFKSYVKETIMNEVLRINKTIGDYYDQPCVMPDMLKQVQDLYEQSKYKEALSLYENNKKDINTYLMMFTSNLKEYQENTIIPLFGKVYYDEETFTRKYAESSEPILTYAEQTSSNDDFLLMYYLQGNRDKAIEFSNKQSDFIKEQEGANSQDYAQAIQFEAEMYYKMNEPRKAIDLMTQAKQIYKLNDNTVRVNYCNKKLNEWRE